jgi:transposase
MHKEVEKYLSLKRKLIVLEYARVFGSNLEAYKACGIPKSTFYDWKKAFEEEGEKGLACSYMRAFQLFPAKIIGNAKI